MAEVRRPCIDRLEDGRGCPKLAVRGGSRCEKHEKIAQARRQRPNDWPKLRSQVRARDRHRCRRCGSRTELEVHHVDGDRANNELSNLLTLCRDCHDEADRQVRARPARLSQR